MAVVAPLTNKPSIVRYANHLLFTTNSECSLTVVLIRSHQQVNMAVILIGRQLNGLSLTGHTVSSILLTKGEGDIAYGNTFVGQQLGSIAVATLEIT